MSATLYRAVAYRLEGLNTPSHMSQPEVHVFFESAGDAATAGATLRYMLAMAWNCPAEEVEFYNLWTEAELQEQCPLNSANAPIQAMGDEALLVCGWNHGPTFCRADRTLMFVCPRTLARLLAARRAAVPWQQVQRDAEMRAAVEAQPKTLAQRRSLQERWEAVSESEMGGLC